MAMSLLVLLTIFIASVSAARLGTRTDQSGAVCTTEFQWATNSQHLSPCSVAAFVIGACFSDNYYLVPLTGDNEYTNPNSTTANYCTCSWAAYNLLSACTACQGIPNSVQNWAAYIQSCGGFLTDVYFPSNITLAQGTAIPFWAATNPTTWQDARFDVNQAQSIANEGKPDLTQTSTQKAKSPVGAIVGGVIGGLAVLALAAGFILFFLFRHRKMRNHAAVGDHLILKHGRSTSDLSGKSQGGALSHADHMISRPGLPPVQASPTLHTHSGSVLSLPYSHSTSGSAYAPSQHPPSLQQLSPQLPPAVQTVHRENIIEPFLLQKQSTSPSISLPPRKGSDNTAVPVYDSPSLPPARSAAVSPQRVRLNPPAYSPSPPQPTDGSSQAPARRDPGQGHRPQGEKGSVDTQNSWESSGNENRSVSNSGEGSISAINDVVSRMGLAMQQSYSDRGNTIATGNSGDVTAMILTNPDVGATTVTRFGLA